jgi:GxxExxY protein
MRGEDRGPVGMSSRDSETTKAQRRMREFEVVPREIEKLAAEVVDAAFRVHKTLGPGLLESVYEVSLAYELRKRGLKLETQVELPVMYESVRLETGFRLDMLVEEQIIVELKAVETMHPLYEAQLLTYLKLTGKRLGLLINFNVPPIRDGIRRIIL